jgi:hypothetical protein
LSPLTFAMLAGLPLGPPGPVVPVSPDLQPAMAATHEAKPAMISAWRISDPPLQ